MELSSSAGLSAAPVTNQPPVSGTNDESPKETNWRDEEEAGPDVNWNLTLPILPCWDESDDGVPPVR